MSHRGWKTAVVMAVGLAMISSGSVLAQRGRPNSGSGARGTGSGGWSGPSGGARVTGSPQFRPPSSTSSSRHYSGYRGTPHYGGYRYDDHHHYYPGYRNSFYSTLGRYPYYGRSTSIYTAPFGYSYYGWGSPGIGLSLGLSGFGAYVPGLNTYFGSSLYGLGASSYYAPSYLSSRTYYGSPSLGTTSPYPIYDPTLTLPSAATSPTSSVSARSSVDEYLQAGRDAFLTGDYAEAQRLANHAVIESPDNAKAHELFGVALFAQGNFAAAAAATHAAASLAPLADWPTLYRYYHNKDKYTDHLRALQQFVKDNPSQVDGHFLLGAHYLMLGHRAEALAELRQYLQSAAGDPVGRNLYEQAGGNVSDLPPATSAPATGVPTGDAPARSTEPTETRPGATGSQSSGPTLPPPVPAGEDENAQATPPVR
ncbi:MAG: tetratricopeptide repeat protein [Pirellulaceae bacterium]